jgi:dinuclear metal center YbgI/SA1388 family protein
MSVDIINILNFFEKNFSDITRQYEWDNSNRQIIVDYYGKVNKVALALDPTKQVIKKAIDKGCELLITHHPLFFGKINSITKGNLLSDKVILAIQNNLNIASYHTNLDLADFSLNDYLAEKLDAQVIDGFIKEGSEKYYKFVVYTPVGYENKIIEAFDLSGAGQIGNYKKCTFSTIGTGTFEPGNNTKPFIGEHGIFEEVKEARIETIVPAKNLSRLIKNVINAHPYEEVAYDIYPIEISKSYSLGRICKLNTKTDLKSFISHISQKLGCAIKYNFLDDNLIFDEFAVVTGSGASLWKHCKQKGVRVFLTGDLKHHDALDAKEEGVVIIDAGHYSTEKIFMEYIQKVLETKFKIEAIIIDEDESIKIWR